MRIVACGQTIAHLPQSMQMVGSQIGSSWAMERFSYFAVPLGKVPSTGSALTGSRSPSPAISRAVNRATKSGSSTTAGGGVTSRFPVPPGRDVDKALQRTVDRGKVALHDRLAALRVGLLHETLDPGDGFVGRQDTGQLEETRLHDGIDPAAHAGLFGDREGIDDPEVDLLVDDQVLHPSADGPRRHRARMAH